MFCYPDVSGGTPDQDTRIFFADDFDFLLQFPKNKSTPRFDSVNTPDEYIGHYLNLWMPYGGSSWYNYSMNARSTKTRLVGPYDSHWSYPILEIYGINDKR